MIQVPREGSSRPQPYPSHWPIPSALSQALNMIKHFKGQHVINVNQLVLRTHLEANQNMKLCKPECLHWGQRQPKKVPLL